MNLYSLALFLRVSGDIGVFIGLGVQLLGLVPLRRAQRVEQYGSWPGRSERPTSYPWTGTLLTIVTGLYMALTVWSLQVGWIAAALGSIVALIAPFTAGMIEPRTRAIVTMARKTPNRPLPASLEGQIHDPALAAGLLTGAAVVPGLSS